MTNLIKRLLAGETLTDAERNQLSAFQMPDTKALEDTINDLRAKLAVATSAKDKDGAALAEIKEQMANLTKAVETERKARLTAETEAKAIKRSQAIDGIRTKHGINFIDGIDPEITRGAFAKAFEGLEDFADEAKVNAAVEGFRKANAGLIRATSGAGGNFGGNQPTNPNQQGSNTEAMAKILSDAGIIRSSK